ncbi:hypothetical protein CHS0354_009773 [Potamilus streckersoni]|uniref:Uncharacterized protein n=1 Tax=Potamilus streckersoni TaxID=2493646 RepID=A0AAE0SVK9_9BIVA|nr:hypothetical protein CHS0354_009773 [Potamilus streckersoni]
MAQASLFQETLFQEMSFPEAPDLPPWLQPWTSAPEELEASVKDSFDDIFKRFDQARKTLTSKEMTSGDDDVTAIRDPHSYTSSQALYAGWGTTISILSFD